MIIKHSLYRFGLFLFFIAVTMIAHFSFNHQLGAALPGYNQEYLDLNSLHLERVIGHLRDYCLDSENQLVTVELLNNVLQQFEALRQQLPAAPALYRKTLHYNFVSLCNAYATVAPSELKPHHIRELRERLHKFLSDINVFYQTKKMILTSNDTAALEMMINLMTLLLSEQVIDVSFFNVGIVDQLIDLTWHRPCEFTNKYPYFVAGASLLAAGSIVYACLFSGDSPSDKDKRSDKKTAENKKSKQNAPSSSPDPRQEPYFDYQSLHVLPQKGLDCGYHSVINSLLLVASQGDAEHAEALMQNPVVEKLVRLMKGLITGYRNLNRLKANPLLQSDEIEFLLHRAQINQYINLLKEIDPKRAWTFNFNNKGSVANIVSTDQPVHNNMNFIRPEIIQLVRACRTGKGIHCIIAHPNMAGREYRHWLSYAIIPQHKEDSALPAFKILEADSQNNTYQDILAVIKELLHDMPLPTAEHIDKIRASLLSLSNLIEAGNLTFQEQCERFFAIVSQALQDGCFNDYEFGMIHKDMRHMFRLLKRTYNTDTAGEISSEFKDLLECPHLRSVVNMLKKRLEKDAVPREH